MTIKLQKHNPDPINMQLNDTRTLVSNARQAFVEGAGHTKIRNLLAAARQAHGVTSHTPIGLDEPTWSVRKTAAIASALNLNGDNLSSLFDKDGKMVRVPNAKIAANSVRLAIGILNSSRVAAAGAHVIVQPAPTRAIPTGRAGDIVLERIPGSFRTFGAATFAEVADDADVSVSPSPFLVADIEWDNSIQKGVRMVFTRSEQKEIDPDLLAAEIVAAVTLGVARAADETLLSHIAGLTPSAFTLAKAATQGLKFGELRALVGTAANGATVDQSGALRAAGIDAELTADMAGTIIGAWDRAAIAIHEDVPLHFERLNTQGHLAVTAWVNLIPLVPDQAKFWTVAA